MIPALVNAGAVLSILTGNVAEFDDWFPALSMEYAITFVNPSVEILRIIKHCLPWSKDLPDEIQKIEETELEDGKYIELSVVSKM